MPQITVEYSTNHRKAPDASPLQAATDHIAAQPARPPIVVTVEVHEIDPEMLFRHMTIK